VLHIFKVYHVDIFNIGFKIMSLITPSLQARTELLHQHPIKHSKKTICSPVKFGNKWKKNFLC